jgi:hypothetical protein
MPSRADIAVGPTPSSYNVRACSTAASPCFAQDEQAYACLHAADYAALSDPTPTPTREALSSAIQQSWASCRRGITNRY